MTDRRAATRRVAFALGLQVAALTACEPDKSDDVQPAVDTVLTREVDVDGDGEADSVRLRLTAQRIDQPFTHKLTILSKGEVILERSATDEWDADFADSSFTAPCTGYERCKRSWYFEQYLATIVQAPSILGDGILDRAVPGNIYETATGHLTRHCGATREAAETAVDSAVARIKAGRLAIVFDHAAPVQTGTPTVWFPEFRCFAPVFEA